MPPDGDIACASYEYDPAQDASALESIVSLKRDERGGKPVRPALDHLLMGPERLQAALAFATARAKAECSKFNKNAIANPIDEHDIIGWKPAEQQEAEIHRILRKVARARRVHISCYLSGPKGKPTPAGTALADEHRRRKKLAILSPVEWQDHLRRQRRCATRSIPIAGGPCCGIGFRVFPPKPSGFLIAVVSKTGAGMC